MTAGLMNICKTQRFHTARRSFLLSADIWNYLKLKKVKMLSSKGLSQQYERKRQKAIRLVAYYNLCNSPLPKHPPKKKTTPKAKKQCSISSTASKVTLIPAFDGAVTANFNRIAIAIFNGSTILRYLRHSLKK